MLRELLKIVQEGGSFYTPVELAQRLDVSAGLVIQMLADLERMGHLTNTTEQPGGCTNCPLVRRCSTKTCTPLSGREKVVL